MIGFSNNLNYLEVVFQNYYYYECFYLINFGLYSCIDKMICLVFCTFVVYFSYLSVLSTFGNTVSVFSAIVTPFFERWFTFKIWVFLVYVQNDSDFFGKIYV